MTWNAFGIDSNGKLVVYKKDGVFVFRDSVIEGEFTRADNEVRSKSFLKSDPYLKYGGIKESLVLSMIVKATNANPRVEGGWDFEHVQFLQVTSNWDFEFEEEYAWAYWSGLVFLRTCASLSLGMWF